MSAPRKSPSTRRGAPPRTVLLATLASLAALAAPGAAQDDGARKRTLADLRQELAARMRAARDAEKPRAAVQAALEAQARELEQFVAREATGDDVHNGRLMLADTWLALRQPDKAKEALAAIDVDKTPALALLAAAELAGAIGMDEHRARLIDAALAKKTPFQERMAIGMHLMTALQEVERGEKVFADAFAAATDDEQRAEVRWYQVAALREREDRDDEAYYKALEKLAREFPDTTWGGIARDRIKAAEHAIGKPPVPLTLTTTDGKTIALADLKGKVVILDFWASWSDHAEEVETFLRDLHETWAEKGLQIVGISLDDTRGDFEGFVSRLKLPWPQVFDGRGWLTHAALRYNVEAIPNVMVLDRAGNIVGHNLLPTNPDERKRIERMVSDAIARQ